MNIFYAKNYSIIDAAVESNYLQFNAPKILSENTSYSQLTRFAELTQLCATFSCEYIETFSYIIQFLPFAEYDLITSTILELLENNDDLLFIQQVLKCNKFVQQVVDNINDLRQCEIQGNRLGNLYRILLKCSQNEFLSKSCSNPQIIAVALDFPEDEDIDVLNPKWALICELYSLNYLSDYLATLEFSFSVIQSISNESYHEYQVNAINFISQVIENNPKVIQKIDCPYLANTIISLFRQFPNHSILLSALVRLIGILLFLKEAIDVIFEPIVTFLLECLNIEDEKIQRTFAIRVITKIINLSHKDDYLSEKCYNNDKFVDIWHGFIYDYEKVRTKRYGYEIKTLNHIHFPTAFEVPQIVE